MIAALRFVPCLAFAMALPACGADRFAGPTNMTTMALADDSDSLTKRYFPGMKGSFYATGRDSAPVFGVVQDPSDPGKIFLAGAGAERSWSAAIPLEIEGMKVTSAVPVTLMSGDVQKDGVLDLLLVVAVDSGDDGTGRTQKREAMYLFELAKKLRLVWYGSLLYEGTRTVACEKGFLRREARPRFQVDDDGMLRKLVLEFDRSSFACEGGEGCAKAQECIRDREEGELVLVWDKDLRLWLPEGATESVLKVPDVSL